VRIFFCIFLRGGSWDLVDRSASDFKYAELLSHIEVCVISVFDPESCCRSSFRQGSWSSNDRGMADRNAIMFLQRLETAGDAVV
jgi:hypothetical protein